MEILDEPLIAELFVIIILKFSGFNFSPPILIILIPLYSNLQGFIHGVLWLPTELTMDFFASLYHIFDHYPADL